jgi:hypothetical protein
MAEAIRMARTARTKANTQRSVDPRAAAELDPDFPQF